MKRKAFYYTYDGKDNFSSFVQKAMDFIDELKDDFVNVCEYREYSGHLDYDRKVIVVYYTTYRISTPALEKDERYA